VKTALTVAGSDSGGGAGIQADLKTFHQFGVFGTTVITAVTAQNTVGVRAWAALPAALVRQQLDAVADDLPPQAVKSGMIGSAELVRAVAEGIADRRLPNYVLDPVMVASSGDRLLDRDAERLVAERLVPLADLVTPNLDEARILTGEEVATPDQMERAGRLLLARGARAALVKGGHLTARSSTFSSPLRAPPVHAAPAPPPPRTAPGAPSRRRWRRGSPSGGHSSGRWPTRSTSSTARSRRRRGSGRATGRSITSCRRHRGRRPTGSETAACRLRIHHYTLPIHCSRGPMPRMVRKQLYIRKDQDKRLKQVAERMGVAEAEYVRMALIARCGARRARAAARSSAWEEILAFLRPARGKGPSRNADWKREDIYDRPYPGRYAR
jgi:hydroxymethylpyrimidine kinase/phosphomethylpyrimidine kinase